ncbi:MAG: hypothetical protein WD025_05255 [Bacteriovoracaceae bacterium]
MKTTLAMAIAALFMSAAYGTIIKEDYPTVKITDAMGSKSVSIKGFCLSDDQKTLKSLAPRTVCVKSKHIGRGYKKCVKKSTQQIEAPNAYYVMSCAGARCSDRVYTKKSYPRDLNIKVYELDPRGGTRTRVDSFTHTLPHCD